MRRGTARLLAFGVVGVLLAVAVGGGTVLLLRSSDGDVVEPSSGRGREAYCSAIDGDLDAVIGDLGPSARPDQLRAGASTLPLLFSAAFVDGAPRPRRDTATRLAAAATAYDGTAPITDVQAAALRTPFLELQRFRATDCP